MEEKVPSVGRPLFLAREVKEIVLEVRRNGVVVDDGTSIFLVLKGAFEEVERTVVLVVEQVLQVLAVGQPEFVSIIILPYFELGCPVMLQEVLVRPFLRAPRIRAS